MSGEILGGQVGFPVTERYECIELLGAGSMGVVFRVRDRETDREVALKTLGVPNAQTLFALKREFRSLADLTHPNLVQLYDLTISDDASFFTMECVEGQDLASRFERTRDWPALRSAFVELLHGLGALHAEGKLHRDVKPKNVMVAAAGRVVLLDFGLVMGVDHMLSVASQRDAFAGTLAYMAPEQAWGQPIGPSADLYSVGVMLYQCLTGCLPFEGPALGSLLDRRERVPEAPSALVSGIPPDLDALAMELLAYDPEERPALGESLDRLRDESARAPSVPRGARSGFVDRVQAFEQLRAAYDETRSGFCRAVLIEGPSGIGKSALVEAYTVDLEREAGALVLRSRCHPQQSVRFEAIDGLVDDLSRFLLQEGEFAHAYLPTQVRPLLRVFPVLNRAGLEVPGEPPLREVDLQEVRRRAFLGLRELLQRIAVRRPLVLWIDDLQWDDADSAPFLRDLLLRDDAPPLLMLASLRTEDRDDSALLSQLRPASDSVIRRIELGPLGPDDAEELMGLLLDAPLEPATQRLVEEASGSPFFLGELARHLLAGAGDAAPEGTVELASIIRERVDSLPPDAREILEIVAVSQRPIHLRVALDLAGLGAGGFPRVYELCNRSLLRSDSTGLEIDIYHGRIRDALLARISPEELRRRHFQIAAGLAASEGAPAAAILDHFLAAGDQERAAPYSVRAAAEADDALAFDRAAELYAQAWELQGARPEDYELLERQGAALAAGGQGADAAAAYARAATAAARAGAPPAHAATLRVRSAAQHFYSGKLEEGTEELRTVLGELDIPLPASAFRALASAGLSFVRFVARGTDFELRPADQVPPEPLLRLDALQGVARGTSMLDHTLSAAIAGRNLLTALELGEPSRALRALALQAGVEANLGGAWLRRRSLRLLERVDQLATETGDAYDAAWAASSRSAVDWFLGRWADCVTHGERAVELLNTGCLGTTWELTANHAFVTSALAQQGELRRLATWIPALTEEARARNDAYASAVYRIGDSVITRLAAGEPDKVLREMEEARAAYTEGDLHSLHFQHLMGSVYTQLYLGAGPSASQQIESTWPALARSGFLRLDCIGNGLRHLRGRAAIAAAGDPKTGPSERKRLLSIADAEARQVARSTLSHNAPNAAALRAGVASVRGQFETSEARLAQAARGYDESGMRLYAEAARWQRAILIGGDEGEALNAAALAWAEEQGVADPGLMFRMALPA